jgi:tetratricopeptide (TPR) repeat protein
MSEVPEQIHPERGRQSLAANSVFGGLLLLMVIVAHGGSFHGPFVFDDEGSIVDNKSIQTLTSPAKILQDGKFTTVAGRPMLNVSLALNYAICGLHPEGYHLVNYAIHAVAALVLFAFLRRLFLIFDETTADANFLALAISLLWCIHPLTINGVSYIVQRVEAMASGLYLVVLWSFVKGVQTSQRRWLVLSVFAAWLGAMTKETIATVPLAVVALDTFLVTRDWRVALRSHWRAYLALMTCWIPLAICMWSSSSRAGTVGFGMGLSLSEHLQTQVWAFARYLRLAIWPQPLTFDYGDHFVMTDLPQVVSAIVVVVGYLLLLVWLVIRKSPLAFPAVALCLLLGPTFVVPIVTQPVAEHRMYLASACVLSLILVPLYATLPRLIRLVRLQTPNRARSFGIVVVPMAAICLLATVQHTRNFASAESLWLDTMQKRPDNPRAVFYVALAKVHEKADLDAALTLLDQVIAMPGRYVGEAYDERGRVRLLKGEYDRAMEDFTQALQLHPNGNKHPVVRAYEHRGRLLAQQGKLTKALEDFDRVIELRPKIVEYYHQRAIVLRDLGRYDDAFRDLQRADAIEPDHPMTNLVRGSVEIACGDYVNALASFDRILATNLDHPAARRSRAGVLAKLERWSEAREDIIRLKQDGRRVDQQLEREVEQHLANLQPSSE